MAGRSVLVNRRCCLRSGIAIFLIEHAEGYLVPALDAYDVRDALTRLIV
jgi:hypothetical protein